MPVASLQALAVDFIAYYILKEVYDKGKIHGTIYLYL